MTHRRWTRIAVVVLVGLVPSAGFAKARPKPRPPTRPPPPVVAPSTPTPPPTSTSSIAVTVIQVAGDQAYLQPGEGGGVHRSSRVVINGKPYAVTQTTASYAVIAVGASPPREHETGSASVVAAEDTAAKELPRPRPVTTWQNAWTVAPPPATEQTPRFVPLGDTERNRRWDVRLSMAGGGLLPLGQLGGSIASAEIDARVHAEPFRAPMAFDLDVGVQKWFASNPSTRSGDPARPLIYLRELQLSYSATSWYGALGRLRYAASTLGALDGAKVRVPLGSGFTIGAFGGLLPNPLGGEPSADAERFGIEGTFSRPDLSLRPEGALVVHGSTFAGSLDERRVSGLFSVSPGPSHIGGHFEVSSFDANNPWKAAAVELTAAGLDSSVRAGPFHLAARFDLLQPERSNWLASYLPTSWFCRTVPAPVGAPATPEPCDGSVSTRTLGSLDAGLEAGPVSVMVGGTAIGDLTQSGGAAQSAGVFASGRIVRILKVMRVDVSGNYSKGTYLDMFGGTIAPGVSLFGDRLDLSVYYRNSTLQYRPDTGTMTQHGVGATVMLFPSSTLLFTFQGEAIAGDDAQALVLFGTAMWRPRL